MTNRTDSNLHMLQLQTAVNVTVAGKQAQLTPLSWRTAKSVLLCSCN